MLRRSGRSVPLYLALLLLTVAAGLASRRFAGALPSAVARYAGDVLWATMVFWILALLRRRVPTIALAAAAFGIAIIVELSQLYHAPWIDGVRAARLGALILGQGFLWSDLVCYAVGVSLAAVLDLLLGAGVREKQPAPVT